jgi:hypothetical protein
MSKYSVKGNKKVSSLFVISPSDAQGPTP